MNPDLQRLRLASIADGISFLILLCIAMPLKYMWDFPIAVRIVGSIHGLLYMIFFFYWALACYKRMISPGVGITLFFAALIPAAPFYMDRYLKSAAKASPQPKAT